MKTARTRRTAATLAAGALMMILVMPARARAQEPRQVSLDEAIGIALRSNPDLQVARADVDAAESRRLNAYGAFLPTVGTGYGFSESSTGRLDPTGQAITTTSHAFQLTARYNVFSGFSRFGQLRSARLGVAAQDAAYGQRRLETILGVTRAYLNALAARELARVERDRLGRQEDQLALVEQQLQLGLVARSDLLRSRVDLNNAKVARVNAESAVRAAGFELARSMGVDWPVEPRPSETLEPDSLAASREEVLAGGLESAPSLVSARAASRAAGAMAAASLSSYLPRLDLIGGFAWQAAEFPPENRSWAIIVQGSFPIFDGFQRESALMSARADARAARAREAAAELALRADLNAAYDRMEAASANIELGRQTVELAHEDLAATRELYRLGRSTILDLRSAEIALQQAEIDLVRSRFDHRVSVAELETLLGRELK